MRWRTDSPGRELYKGKIVAVNYFRPAIRLMNSFNPHERGNLMNNIVYIIGAVVIVIAVLSFFGLR